MTEANLVLIPDIWAPSKARDLLLRMMADRTGTEELHKALLAVSEVVANAVGDGADGGSDPITLLIDRTEELVTVRVVQARPIPERPSVASMPEGWSIGGYGLAVLEAVADRWGIGLDPPVVWFELHL